MPSFDEGHTTLDKGQTVVGSLKLCRKNQYHKCTNSLLACAVAVADYPCAVDSSFRGSYLGQAQTSFKEVFSKIDHVPLTSSIDRMENQEKDNSVFSLSDASEDQDKAASIRELNEKERQKERKTLARAENKAVFFLRISVLVVLSVAASAVAYSSYSYTKGVQSDAFVGEFASYADRILDSFHMSIERKFEAMQGISAEFTSHAQSTGATFPNVTLPNYEVRSAIARVLGGTMVLNYYAKVLPEQRAGWGAFFRENVSRQYNEALQSETYQRIEQDARFGRSDEFNYSAVGRDPLPVPGRPAITPFIPYSGNEAFALPMWHMSPVIPFSAALGLDFCTHPATGSFYKRAIEVGKVVMGTASNLREENLEGSGNTAVYVQEVQAHSQYRYEDKEQLLKDPTSQIGYPVFDSFNHTTRSPVGVLSATIYWRLMFNNILPTSAKGITVILENTLNQSMTFQIDGQETTYLGVGDLHDHTYDHMMESGNVADYLRERRSPTTQSLTAVEIDLEFSSYSLRVYPSSATADVFVDGTPIWYMCATLIIFFFTSCVFVFYDRLVARRQKIVLERAVASSAIVSSLFPSEVRTEVYDQNNKTAAASKRNAWKIVHRDEINSGEHKPKKQIAQEYAATTVMFADIAGFTKWSSERTPVEVFELLEAMYHEFDMVALRLKIFKVETIGDCYVAVAGLPEPQPDHAIRMAKFASMCLGKMENVLTNLVDKLGNDTTNLALRVGLHSGKVTGGVLRGQKSRFQLFGDTMNTAARMEANGLPGRIHVSETTMAAIKEGGKESWLEARSEKVFAKGKGMLQTYWCTPAGVATTTGSSTPSLHNFIDL